MNPKLKSNSNWFFYLLILPLLILVISISNSRYFIGGDITIPFNPLNNLHKLELWHSGKESLHYLHTLWYFYYAGMSLLGVSSLFAQKILIIFTYISGFIFTFLLHKELFENKTFGSSKWAYLSALIFTFNPVHFLLPPAYLPIFGFPISIYFLVKFIKTLNLFYPILFSLALNFFFFVDLPQPKLLLVFGYATLIILILLKTITKYKFSTLFIRTFYLFFFSLCFNLWVILPTVRSVFSGLVSTFVSNVQDHNGLADLGSASLIYISRFYNSSLINNYPKITFFLTNPLFTIWTVMGWLLIIASLVFPQKKSSSQKIGFVLLLGVLMVWLAKGPNPPFGGIYIFLTRNFPLMRIFRTTASVVAGFVVFYSLLLSLAVFRFQNLLHKKVFPAFVLLHLLVFSPLYLGFKYYNDLHSDPFQKGFAIPQEYFRTAEKLDELDPSSRVIAIPKVEGYVQKKWHYFGPDIISWITKVQFVGAPTVSDISTDNLAQNQLNDLQSLIPGNATHILVQKDAAYNHPLDLSRYGLLIHQDGYFDLYQINSRLTLQPFFTDVPGDSVTISSKQLSKTRFSLKIENMTDDFNLISSETYDPGWGLFLLPTSFDNKLKVWLNKPVTDNHIHQNSYPWPHNSWIIKPSEFCQQNELCQKQPDGSYTAEFVINYWPQQFFYFSLLVSIISTTTLLLLGLLLKRL